MIALAWFLLFFVAISVLAYKRASLSVWSIGLLFYLLLVSKFAALNGSELAVLWIIFLSVGVVLNLLPLRRKLITHPIFILYQRLKPSISSTEKEALSIGTVGWEGELFSGMPDWNKFTTYQAPELNSEEIAFLGQEVEQLCQMLNNWEINHTLFNLPEEVWQFIKEKGFFGLIIPKQYGGKEFSALAHSAIISKIASHNTAAATIVAVPNSLGPAELLLEYGTPEQKNYYLPRLASGEEIPCFALTSPDAGSDAGAMPDYGIVSKGQWEDKEVIGIRLHWDKRYITLAPVATLLGLAFKLYDPEHLLSESEERGITCALIPTHIPGVQIGRRHYPLNSPFPNGPTQGRDVFIPLEFIIGGVQMAGQGWHMLMECLSTGRAITLPSISTGTAKSVAFASGAYARIRTQFNSALSHFDGIKEALARIAGRTYIMDATRLFAVAAIDRGERSAVSSAISKYHTTELGRLVANDAMDVHGGKGICMGPRNYIAQGYEEAPISITVEGANILTRSMIIFGQGVMRCHPYLLRELAALEKSDPSQALIQFDRALFSHIGFLISNKARAFYLGITGGRLGRLPGDKVTRSYYQQLNRFSAAFALIADATLLSLGGAFKRSENLSGKLADTLSMLYLGSALLKHFENQGSPEEDIPLLAWAFQTILFKLKTALDNTLKNFPNRYLAILLRICIFPLGTQLREPDDALSQKVAALLSAHTSTRDRLAQGAYLTPDQNNKVALINLALRKIIAAADADKKLLLAEHAGRIKGKNTAEKISAALEAGILTSEEFGLLQEADIARKEVIAVDDFDKQGLENRFNSKD